MTNAEAIKAIDAEIQRQESELQRLREELAEETEAADNWRRLALQFDNHRMQALGHLKAVVNPGAVFDAYKAAKAFLNAPPLDGEKVLAQRIAELAATPEVDAGNPVSESDVPVGLPEPAAWLATFRPKGLLSSHSVAGVNLEELKRTVPSDSEIKPLYTHLTTTDVGMGIPTSTSATVSDATDGEPANDEARELCRRWGECVAEADSTQEWQG